MPGFVKVKVCAAETQADNVKNSILLNKTIIVAVDRLVKEHQNPANVIYFLSF